MVGERGEEGQETFKGEKGAFFLWFFRDFRPEKDC